MVSSEPSPSTRKAPPSSTNGALNMGTPKCLATRSGTRASWSCGCQRFPQALKPNFTRATSPWSLVTNAGPLSRAQESSTGTSSGSTPAPQWATTSAARPGLHSMTTGSNAAMARATAA